MHPVTKSAFAYHVFEYFDAFANYAFLRILTHVFFRIFAVITLFEVYMPCLRITHCLLLILIRIFSYVALRISANPSLPAQITALVAVMSMDLKRTVKGKVDVLCCIQGRKVRGRNNPTRHFCLHIKSA